MATARQRLATLEWFDELAKTHGNAKAAKLAGASVVSLWRWRRAYAKHGLVGLQPLPPSGGKPAAFAQVKLSVKAVREIERFTAEHGSARAAWQQFAGSPLCPPALAAYISHHGHAPARLAGVGRVWEVKARAYVSADGRRLLVRLPCQGTIATAVAIPAGLKPFTKEVH